MRKYLSPLILASSLLASPIAKAGENFEVESIARDDPRLALSEKTRVRTEAALAPAPSRSVESRVHVDAVPVKNASSSSLQVTTGVAGAVSLLLAGGLLYRYVRRRSNISPGTELASRLQFSTFPEPHVDGGAGVQQVDSFGSTFEGVVKDILRSFQLNNFPDTASLFAQALDDFPGDREKLVNTLLEYQNTVDYSLFYDLLIRDIPGFREKYPAIAQVLEARYNSINKPQDTKPFVDTDKLSDSGTSDSGGGNTEGIPRDQNITGEDTEGFGPTRPLPFAENIGEGRSLVTLDPDVETGGVASGEITTASTQSEGEVHGKPMDIEELTVQAYNLLGENKYDELSTLLLQGVRTISLSGARKILSHLFIATYTHIKDSVIFKTLFGELIVPLDRAGDESVQVKIDEIKLYGSILDPGELLYKSSQQIELVVDPSTGKAIGIADGAGGISPLPIIHDGYIETESPACVIGAELPTLVDDIGGVDSASSSHQSTIDLAYPEDIEEFVGTIQSMLADKKYDDLGAVFLTIVQYPLNGGDRKVVRTAFLDLYTHITEARVYKRLYEILIVPDLSLLDRDEQEMLELIKTYGSTLDSKEPLYQNTLSLSASPVGEPSISRTYTTGNGGDIEDYERIDRDNPITGALPFDDHLTMVSGARQGGESVFESISRLKQQARSHLDGYIAKILEPKYDHEISVFGTLERRSGKRNNPMTPRAERLFELIGWTSLQPAMMGRVLTYKISKDVSQSSPYRLVLRDLEGLEYDLSGGVIMGVVSVDLKKDATTPGGYIIELSIYEGSGAAVPLYGTIELDDVYFETKA